MGSQAVRDRIALVLMLLAALGALYAAVTSIGEVTSGLINRASHAVANGVVDGILSVFLIAAYLLTRGYQATRARA